MSIYTHTIPLDEYLPTIYSSIQNMARIKLYGIQSVELVTGETWYFDICLTNLDYSDIRKFKVHFAPNTPPEEINKIVISEVMRHCDITSDLLGKVEEVLRVTYDKEWDII